MIIKENANEYQCGDADGADSVRDFDESIKPQYIFILRECISKNIMHLMNLFKGHILKRQSVYTLKYSNS